MWCITMASIFLDIFLYSMRQKFVNFSYKNESETACYEGFFSV